MTKRVPKRVVSEAMFILFVLSVHVCSCYGVLVVHNVAVVWG